MVFPGRFSTGCMRCRQRKVKCDETKPSCRRCHIYGKECPGYTDQFHFRHGLTTSDFASDKKIKPAPIPPPTPSPTKSTWEHSSPDTLEAQIKLESPEPTPLVIRRRRKSKDEEDAKPRVHKVAKANRNKERRVIKGPSPQVIKGPSPQVIQPSPSYEQMSLCYFVQRFISPSGDDAFPGHLSFLPGLFDHGQGGLLETATLSVAQIAAYNHFGGAQMRTQSYQNYGKAVLALQDAIANEDAVKDDRVLAAILLLCMFKDVHGDGDIDHASGIYYILEKRGPEQLATKPGFELYILALLRLQVYSFLQNKSSYCDPGGLVAFLANFDPLMHAMALMGKGLRLRTTLSQQNATPDVSQPLMEECFELIGEFDKWDSEAATNWKQSWTSRNVPTSLGEVAQRPSFYDPETACTVILVRSARLILFLSMLEYLNSCITTAGPTSETSTLWSPCLPTLEQDVRLTIADMLACVPYALGDLDADMNTTSMPHDAAAALMIMQPMRLVTYSPHATPEQIAQSEAVLARINATMGIRAAVSWSEQAKASNIAPWAACGSVFGDLTDVTATC